MSKVSPSPKKEDEGTFLPVTPDLSLHCDEKSLGILLSSRTFYSQGRISQLRSQWTHQVLVGTFGFARQLGSSITELGITATQSFEQRLRTLRKEEEHRTVRLRSQSAWRPTAMTSPGSWSPDLLAGSRQAGASCQLANSSL